MKKSLGALALLALIPLLSSCAPTVALQPADDAINPACAEVIVGLRNLDTVAELEPRETDAQATAAWGSPASVILTCGVAVPAPTATFPCYTVDGIDWLRDDTDAPIYYFTTYGRDPAVQVAVDSDAASALSALTDLSRPISAIAADGMCISPLDTTTDEDTSTD